MRLSFYTTHILGLDTLLMTSPQYKSELPNSSKLGHYMSLQRALLCLICGHGSFFRNDHREGPIDPNFKVFRSVLNSSNYQTEVLDNLPQITDYLLDKQFVLKSENQSNLANTLQNKNRAKIGYIRIAETFDHSHFNDTGEIRRNTSEEWTLT